METILRYCLVGGCGLWIFQVLLTAVWLILAVMVGRRQP